MQPFVLSLSKHDFQLLLADRSRYKFHSPFDELRANGDATAMRPRWTAMDGVTALVTRCNGAAPKAANF